jgi:hypothetical protein
MLRRRTLLLAAAMVMAANAPHAAVGATDWHPGAMVLAPGDLPHEMGGWKQMARVFFDNTTYARVRHLRLADVVASGRLTGYGAIYVEKLVKPLVIDATTGKSSNDTGRVLIGCCIDELVTQVDVYDSAADARTAFRIRPRTSKPVKTTALIGDELRLGKGTYRAPYDGVDDQPFWRVTWRKGAVIGLVTVEGFMPTVGDALALARRQEQAIAAAIEAGHRP